MKCTREKLAEQRDVVYILCALQKLERMFLTFKDPIQPYADLEIPKDATFLVISDFKQSHPFDVNFLVDSLIACYRKLQVEMNSNLT